MKRPCVVFLGLLLTWPMTAAPAPKPPPKQDSIYGDWEIVQQFKFGPGGPGGGSRIVITFKPDGKTVWSDGKTPDEFGSFKIDASQNPPHIDFVSPAQANPKNGLPPSLGIYQLEKDTLTIYMVDGGPRPTKFEAPPRSGIQKMTLKRVPKK